MVLHCHQVWPGDDHWAGIDIFRFDEHGKVVEHGDVLQRIPPMSRNGNGMFWTGGQKKSAVAASARKPRPPTKPITAPAAAPHRSA